MKKISWVAIVLSCLLALLFVHPLAFAARPIKVGVIDCYTGPAAMFCNEALNGFRFALNEINKEGVLGGKIEFTIRDTNSRLILASAWPKSWS